VNFRQGLLFGAAFAAAFSAAAQARDFEMGGDSNYPYSIMAPEPGVATHHHSAPTATRHVRASHRDASPVHDPSPAAKQDAHQKFYAVRGCWGWFLPTPLPRTPLIPPEGGGTLTLPTVPREQGPTILQGSVNPIPNLPHGPESFQDRASRCAFQQGLSNVPGTLGSQYIGNCVQ